MAWACRCGSSIRSEAARSGGPVIFKKILVLLERRYSKAIALQAATTPTSPAPSGSMGAEVSLAQCGCGTNERGDGRLDVSWQAPQTLVRTPNGKLSGATPGTPESPKKKAELTQVAARELAVRLLPNSKNGRSHDIEKMFHKYDLAPEQINEGSFGRLRSVCRQLSADPGGKERLRRHLPGAPRCRRECSRYKSEATVGFGPRGGCRLSEGRRPLCVLMRNDWTRGGMPGRASS